VALVLYALAEQKHQAAGFPIGAFGNDGSTALDSGSEAGMTEQQTRADGAPEAGMTKQQT